MYYSACLYCLLASLYKPDVAVEFIPLSNLKVGTSFPNYSFLSCLFPIIPEISKVPYTEHTCTRLPEVFEAFESFESKMNKRMNKNDNNK